MTGPCDGEGVSLDATLLIVTDNSSSSGKYRRIWRRYLFVRFLLSIRKTIVQTGQLPYSPLPAASAQAECVIGIDPDSDSVDVQSKADQQLYSAKDILKIVKARDTVSLRALGGVDKAASILTSYSGSASRLLPHQRLVRQAKTLLRIFLTAWNSFTILLLLLCAGLSFAVQFLEQGLRSGWHDGAAILATVFLLVTSRCVSELRIKKNRSKVEVMRNGERLLVPLSHLASGDVVGLNEGDVVPVDGLFVYGETLVLDDNSKADRFENPFLLRGSEVIEGCGNMMVVSDSEGSDTEEPTLFAARIHKPNSYIEILGLAVSVLIAFVVLVGLICRRQHKNDDILPELKGSLTIDGVFKIFESTFLRPRGKVHILTGTLAAFLIGMQHGMPFAITVSLSFWNWKMEFCGAKPQNLSACGTMGLVTVICVNATGGIMCDDAEVQEFFVGGEDMYHSVDPKLDKVMVQALRLGMTNDVAVSAWAKSKLGWDIELSDRCFSVVDDGRLIADTQCSRVVIKENENGGILHMHLKGDASTILNLCSHYYDRTGEIHPMEDEGVHFRQVVADMKSRGLKTVAFACKQVETAESLEEGSYLLALVGLKYAFQEIIQEFRKARVRIKLVSQDELSAVRQIAHQLQIVPPGSNCPELEGEQVRDPSCPDRMKRIEESIVIGSCLTEDMLLAVTSLKENGHVVAFFGGLTARETMLLKEADIGITKENKSTEKARVRSDIVISDEHALPRVIQLGIYAYNNIHKFTQLQLTSCFSGLLINLIAAICSWDSPLTPIQLIYINFATCLKGCLMMVMELRSDDLNNNSPAERTDPLINKATWKCIAMQVLSRTTLSIILHFMPGVNEETWKAMVFNSFMICQLVFNEVNLKTILGLETGKSVYLGGLGSLMMMQVIVVEFGKSLSGFKRLSWLEWLFCLIIAAVSYGVAATLRFISIQQLGFLRRRPPLFSLLGIPLCMFYVYYL